MMHIFKELNEDYRDYYSVYYDDLDYEYTVEEWAAVDTLFSIMRDEDEYDHMRDSELKDYIRENIDELWEKYQEELKEEFRVEAEFDAEEEQDEFEDEEENFFDDTEDETDIEPEEDVDEALTESRKIDGVEFEFDKEQFIAPDIAWLDGQSFDDVEFDDDRFYDELQKVLNDRFLGMMIEDVQVAGGGYGPDEWYDEDDCPIYSLEWDGEELYIGLENELAEPDESDGYYGARRYRELSATHYGNLRARVSDHQLGLTGDYTPKDLMERFINIPLKEFHDLVANNIDY